MSVEPAAWESFAWRSGAEEYRFNIKDRGLIGHISVSDGRNFALPIVVWEALFDAVKTNRKAKTKAEGVSCLNNLRQLQLGWFMYSGDNDDKIARTGGLNDLVTFPNDPAGQPGGEITMGVGNDGRTAGRDKRPSASKGADLSLRQQRCSL